MICSVLIPSRVRPQELKKCIASLGRGDFEVIIRVDADDPYLSSYTEIQNIQCLTGVCHGYTGIYKCLNEMMSLAKGDWLWVLNDDMTVEGGDLSGRLFTVPKHGFIVQPETMQLGFSRYRHSEGGAAPVVPRNCWQEYGQKEVLDPYDIWIDQLLRVRNGWKTHFLAGITVNHQRLKKS